MMSALEDHTESGSRRQIRARAALRQGAPARPAPKTAAPQKQAAEDSEYELLLQSRKMLDALEDAKLRRAKALTEHREIDNMLRRDELLPVAHVRRWVARLLIEARDELLRLSGELCNSLAVETDPMRITPFCAPPRNAPSRCFLELTSYGGRSWRDEKGEHARAGGEA